MTTRRGWSATCGALAVGLTLALPGGVWADTATAKDASATDFPVLPAPPPVDALYGLSLEFPRGREAYLAQLSAAADEVGLPAALADAVAFVESGYEANARGADGEVGIMQILPTTAAMLGHRGTWAELFDPKVNIRYGVKYLAKAWQLAEGDVCRALMKYRAGHGEERMTLLSVRYCARARAHLARIGSPLVTGAGSVDEKIGIALATLEAAPTKRQAKLTGYRRGKVRTQADSRRFWAAHEKRIRALNAKLTASRQRISSRT